MELSKTIRRSVSALNKKGKVKVCCPKTGAALYALNENKDKIPITSFGTCFSCKCDYSLDNIHLPIGVGEQAWPVHYEGEGLFCLPCFEMLKVEQSTETQSQITTSVGVSI